MHTAIIHPVLKMRIMAAVAITLLSEAAWYPTEVVSEEKGLLLQLV